MSNNRLESWAFPTPKTVQVVKDLSFVIVPLKQFFSSWHNQPNRRISYVRGWSWATTSGAIRRCFVSSAVVAVNVNAWTDGAEICFFLLLVVVILSLVYQFLPDSAHEMRHETSTASFSILFVFGLLCFLGNVNLGGLSFVNVAEITTYQAVNVHRRQKNPTKV